MYTQVHWVYGEISPQSIKLPVFCESNFGMSTVCLDVNSQGGYFKIFLQRDFFAKY